MNINKKENLQLIRTIKQRLENSMYQINIEKTEESGKIDYVINFEKKVKDISNVDTNEKINELTATLLSSFNNGINYPTIEFLGKMDDFLEVPTSLLFELFRVITDKQSQKNIYKTLYGNVNVIESFNEVTDIKKIKTEPQLVEKMIKFLMQEEIKEEYKNIVTLHTVLGYMSKINIEDRKDYNEEIFELLKSYKSLIIEKDNENKYISRIPNIRETISMYINNTGIDNNKLNKFREFFPVGKNNGHINNPTESDLFIESNYNIRNIVLDNNTLLAYYPTMILHKDIDQMLEDIIKVIKIKENDFFKSIEIGLLEKNTEKEEQSIFIKISKDENEEKTIKQIKALIIGMMDAYQQCCKMDEKEKKNYLEKATDAVLLSLKLANKVTTIQTEIKKLKI